MTTLPFALMPEKNKNEIMHMVLCKCGVEVSPGVYEIKLDQSVVDSMPDYYRCEIESDNATYGLTLRLSASEAGGPGTLSA